MSSCRVRIWFLELASDESDHEEWTDINDGLVTPESLLRTMAIEFSVMHFSGRFSGYVTFVIVINMLVLFGTYLHDAAWAMLTPTLGAFNDSVHTSLQCLCPSRVDIRKRLIQKRNSCGHSLRRETNSANIFPKVHVLLGWVDICAKHILLELSSKTLKFISTVIKLVFNL